MMTDSDSDHYQIQHGRYFRNYQYVEVLAGKRQVQIFISPTGRSVRVWVDGEEIR